MYISSQEITILIKVEADRLKYNLQTFLYVQCNF